MVSGDKGVRLGTVLEDIFLRTALFGAIFAKKRGRSWQKWHQRDLVEDICLVIPILIEVLYHMIPEKDDLWKKSRV